MQKVYEKYVEDNDGVDISFPDFIVGKNAKAKAKHKMEEAKAKFRREKLKSKYK